MESEMFKVTIQRTDMIKPSSPTPTHLSRHNFSFFDQIAPSIFMPLCLFYPKDDDGLEPSHRIDRLRVSLSDSLSTFYPLAGRVRDNLYVDCGDQGVYYAEAYVSCKLSEVLKQPSPEALTRLLPFQLYNLEDYTAALQVNLFECGGLGICLCISHKVADAFSYFTFLNCWAATARGDIHGIITPCFNMASLFPPINLAGYTPDKGILKEGLATKRFVFGSPAITSLKVRYTDDSMAIGNRSKHPTRVEALSAFMWGRYVQNMHSKGKGATSEGQVYTMVHPVNLRTRMEPSLSESYFGNLVQVSITKPRLDDETKTVSQMRESTREINAESVKKLQGEWYLNFLKEMSRKGSMGEEIPLIFTSLCRFPVHGADFGWGKPAWTGSMAIPLRNFVVFLDCDDGEGVVAYVNLGRQEMEVFEKDVELLKYSSSSFQV